MIGRETETQTVSCAGVEQNELSELLLPTYFGSSKTRSTTANLVLDDESTPQERTKLSQNVIYTLIYTWIAFAGRSVWNQTVLSAYVYLRSDDNPEALGYITAVMGVSQLLASFPTGWMADLHRRDVMLKIGSFVGILATIVTLTALYLENIKHLILALAMWGMMDGVCNTSLSALFADSIQDGKRTKYCTYRDMLLTIGTTTGPLVALFMFYMLGDKWTIRDCSIVMIAGQLLCLPGIFLLCFFKDDFDTTSATSMAPSTEIDSSIPTDASPTENHIASQSLTNGDDAVDENENHLQQLICHWIPKNRTIPVLIALADVLAGLASGMSVRYFPIFFMKNLHLSPVAVQVLYLVSRPVQAFLMKIALLSSASFGRCQMAIVYKWIGSIFMVLMIFSYLHEFPTWCTCVLYVLRTSFTQSTRALTKSVVMDAVPKHERAKWSSLESVNTLSWSGSVALGGLIVKYEGILFNFCFTACLQLLGTLPLIVASKMQEKKRTIATNSNRETESNSFVAIRDDASIIYQSCESINRITLNG